MRRTPETPTTNHEPLIMRILVTGAAGFVGRHALHAFMANGHECIAADVVGLDALASSVTVTAMDLCNRQAVHDTVAHFAPDACLHLGGIAFVPTGSSDPDLVFSVNVVGTVNILEAFRSHAPQARVLVVTSGQVYGIPDSTAAITETAPFAPTSLYAVSKGAADLAAMGYAQQFDMPIMTARPGNHTGPGQSPSFVVPSFARQLKAIADGEAPPTITVGNLESERSFADVRDVVHGYRLLLESGRNGESYNIGADHNVPIGTVLKQLCELLDIQPETRVDQERFRPTDRSPILSTEKLTAETGWQQKIPFEQTLRDILEAL